MKRLYNRFLLRVVSFVSFFSGLFWTTGVILDEATEGPEPGWMPLFALCFFITLLIYAIVLRKAPSSLTIPRGAAWWKPAGTALFLTCICYLVILPVFWLLAHLLAMNFWPDPNHSQAGLFKLQASLWLSAWWAPGLGAVSYYNMSKVPRG
jgi:hypothetical protein